jgi:hypothetical protein
MHIHPHLSIFVKNSPYTVPVQIGIDSSMWKDHSLDEFGMQSMSEMNMSAMAPLRTHDSSGNNTCGIYRRQELYVRRISEYMGTKS